MDANVNGPVAELTEAIQRLTCHQTAGRDYVGLEGAPLGYNDHWFAFGKATDRIFDARIHAGVILRIEFGVVVH